MATIAAATSTYHDDAKRNGFYSDVVKALATVPAVLALLGLGIAVHLPSAGAVAAGASFTVGFGAFKRVHGSPMWAMLLAAVGIGVSAFIGTLAGQAAPAMIAAAALWGFVAGVLPAISADIGWVGQQSTIFLLIAAAFPGSIGHAADRALLVFCGATLQFVSLGLILRLFTRAPAGFSDIPGSAQAASRTLVSEIRSWSSTVARALRIAVVIGVAVGAWRWFALSNGYWLGMTVLLLVKPNPGGTFWRATERVAGTVGGAILATVVTHYLPSPPPLWLMAIATASLAGLTLTLQQGNTLGNKELTFPGSYAVFACALTAYVIFLLDYGGLSPRGVAEQRVFLTVAGGVLALAVHFPFERLSRKLVFWRSPGVD